MCHSALFDGQIRYFLDINNRSEQADVLRFRGREALSKPFKASHLTGTLNCNDVAIQLRHTGSDAGILYQKFTLD